jgi:hypothetical protein
LRRENAERSPVSALSHQCLRGAITLLILLLLTTSACAAEESVLVDEAVSEWEVRFYVQRGLLLLVAGGVLTGIYLARWGRALPIRDIPALLAFEEAVARATEMGRPALFTAGGASEIRRVQTFAAMPLLRHVAKLSGELGNELMVPVCYPETMPLHANAVRDGYMDAGTPEQYRAEDLRFFPGGQFFFAIAAMGWMLEEQPAACFYFGWWEADSLMFAETGQTIQAMQIAGTDQLAQVPFFVASCDYTLIGEEFWAASAKIGRDPQLLGSMGAQDLFKLALLVLMVGGIVLCLHPGFAAWMSSVRALFVQSGG